MIRMLLAAAGLLCLAGCLGNSSKDVSSNFSALSSGAQDSLKTIDTLRLSIDEDQYLKREAYNYAALVVSGENKTRAANKISAECNTGNVEQYQGFLKQEKIYADARIKLFADIADYIKAISGAAEETDADKAIGYFDKAVTFGKDASTLASLQIAIPAGATDIASAASAIAKYLSEKQKILAIQDIARRKDKLLANAIDRIKASVKSSDGEVQKDIQAWQSCEYARLVMYRSLNDADSLQYETRFIAYLKQLWAFSESSTGIKDIPAAFDKIKAAHKKLLDGATFEQGIQELKTIAALFKQLRDGVNTAEKG